MNKSSSLDNINFRRYLYYLRSFLTLHPEADIELLHSQLSQFAFDHERSIELIELKLFDYRLEKSHKSHNIYGLYDGGEIHLGRIKGLRRLKHIAKQCLESRILQITYGLEPLKANLILRRVS